MHQPVYKREDFVNQNEVRWCPGCGDYAILAALQRLLPELGLPPEKHVFVSGIGCAGRLPYYMNTYGFHTIHGRATAVATGLKLMRDDLSVWVITGDGDALSIGGNHFIHCLRRNVNINILLINNQVYGLTKGQYSPTSQPGQVTKTSPQGLKQEPINPLLLALAAGATFVARAVDKDPTHLQAVLKAAYEHSGTSLIEIYQDCNIFNHGAFDGFALKDHRKANTVLLADQAPLQFGIDHEEMLVYSSTGFTRMPYQHGQAYHHDVNNFTAAIALAKCQFPALPVPLGIFYQAEKDLYPTHQMPQPTASLKDLYRVRACWQDI